MLNEKYLCTFNRYDEKPWYSLGQFAIHNDMRSAKGRSKSLVKLFKNASLIFFEKKVFFKEG